MASRALFWATVWTCLSLPSPTVAFAISAASDRPSRVQQKRPELSHRLYSTSSLHPAVEGWPEKYAAPAASSNNGRGPRILHSHFAVEPATEYLLYQLDVANWPTWTTSDKPKWAVGNQNRDKIMPYGELSYVLAGKLEIIIPSSTSGVEERYVVEKGDFVTFPEGFQASWRVLEELTWHYYLY